MHLCTQKMSGHRKQVKQNNEMVWNFWGLKLENLCLGILVENYAGEGVEQIFVSTCPLLFQRQPQQPRKDRDRDRISSLHLN